MDPVYGSFEIKFEFWRLTFTNDNNTKVTKKIHDMEVGWILTKTSKRRNGN